MADLPIIHLCLELGPDDMGDGSDNKDRFAAFFHETFLEAENPMIGGGGLHIVDEAVCDRGDVARIADFFMAYLGTEDGPGRIIGGYGFMIGHHYLFGAERDFAFSRQWEHAFARLDRSPVQEVFTDDHRFKVIANDGTLLIYRGDARWQSSLVEAVPAFQRAQATKARFASLFLARVGEVAGAEAAESVRKRCLGGQP
jgi:hypothetical protein